MKTWVARMLSVVLGVAAILKLSETWLFDSSAWLTQVHFNGGPDSLRHKHFQDDDEFPAFYEPSIKTERCDACRIIATSFDTAFEIAEQRIHAGGGMSYLDQELTQPEVNAIVNQICTRANFARVTPFSYNEYDRLAGPGIETWQILQSKPDDLPAGNSKFEPTGSRSAGSAASINWPQRMKNHCRFFSEKLKGIEIYDMWLRTSANTANGFDMFLCYGEGPFGDCLDWIDTHERWPAGDEVPEGDEDDDEEGLDEDGEASFLPDLAALMWEKQANSAASISA